MILMDIPNGTSFTSYIPIIIIAIVVILIIANAAYTVKEKTNTIIQRLGKFHKISMPGLSFKLPIIDSIAGTLSLKVEQLPITVETKTKDNVFVKIVIPIQYQVIESKAGDAFYKLSNPQQQIESYVFDVVRAIVPDMDLDEVFAKKEDVATRVKTALDIPMEDYGFRILNVLVTDIDPDEKVKNAMNDINAAQRERVAAESRGETEKIITIKKAEAEKESKRLSGEGIAAQRSAIVKGLQSSIEDFQKVIKDSKAEDVMTLVLLTQYFDTMKEIGANDKSNTIFMTHSPGGMSAVAEEIKSAITSASVAADYISKGNRG
jgi:regulator of protease activity HflC (stomatin/prohibitin superfamily)